jgi:hypothetical protein
MCGMGRQLWVCWEGDDVEKEEDDKGERRRRSRV